MRLPVACASVVRKRRLSFASLARLDPSNRRVRTAGGQWPWKDSRPVRRTNLDSSPRNWSSTLSRPSAMSASVTGLLRSADSSERAGTRARHMTDLAGRAGGEAAGGGLGAAVVACGGERRLQ